MPIYIYIYISPWGCMYECDFLLSIRSIIDASRVFHAEKDRNGEREITPQLLNVPLS